MYLPLSCFLVVLFFGSASILSAQSIPPNQVEWQQQIGTDITPLITRVLNFGGTAASESFSFIYRKRIDSQTHQRTGANVSLSIDGTSDISQADFGLAFGKEKVQTFSKRWAAYHGWEGRLQVNGQRFGNLDVTRVQIDLGPAILAGLYFNINDHLVLSTEASLVVFMRILSGGLEEGIGLNADWKVPTALYLSYRW